MRREPVVSGQFYYGNPERLASQVDGMTSDRTKKVRAIGAVAPHAGLMYSGAVAGAVYSAIEMPDTFVILGPNHTGFGSAIAIMSQGQWEIPTGVFEIDSQLAASIMKGDPNIEDDPLAHRFEHSIEVQLPFIARFTDTAKIVPIAIMSATPGALKTLGEAIASAIKQADYGAVVVASSDMSHYVSDHTAREKDRKAIERVLALDPGGLYETVNREGISMCGYMPAVAMLYASKELGATSAELVMYATSGEVSGDYDRVVGYAGILVR